MVYRGRLTGFSRIFANEDDVGVVSLLSKIHDMRNLELIPSSYEVRIRNDVDDLFRKGKQALDCILASQTNKVEIEDSSVINWCL